jgi:hypothetical protein
VSAYKVRGDHLQLIAKSNVKYSIRGGTGLVFTFITLLVGLILASVFISPIEEIQKMAAAETGGDVSRKVIVDQVVSEIGKPAVKWALGTDDAHAAYLVETKPAIVSAILLTLLFALPFLIALGAFNQLAGDIQHKGLRYVLLRTERANLFFGRFLGTYLFCLLVLALLMGVILLYLVFKADFYPAGDVILWIARGYGALAIYALPWVALCAWFSAANDSPFVSLVLAKLLIGFVPLLVWLGAKAWKPFEYAGYVLPWPLKYDLLHPSLLHSGLASLAMVAYAAVFLALGARTFQKRDL